MKTGNVAIVSANKELIRFFELEIATMDCNVNIFNQGNTVPDNYDFIIVDKDTVSNMSGTYACPIIVVSSNHEGSTDTDIFSLPWPTPLILIRNICKRFIHSTEVSLQNEKKDMSEPNTVYVSDRENCAVVIENCRIKLSKTEFAILEMLCNAEGKTVPRERIMDLLGARDGNISDVYICHLRKKLEVPLGKRLIFTERQKGYKTLLVINK